MKLRLFDGRAAMPTDATRATRIAGFRGLMGQADPAWLFRPTVSWPVPYTAQGDQGQ